MEGGFFLIARGDTEQNGQRTKHVEIIGYDHEASAENADTLTSRLYTNRGDSLSYTHEIDDKGMTSWFGPKGSAAFFKARWIDDDTLTGAWEWAGRRLQADLIARRRPSQSEGLVSSRLFRFAILG